jgi:cytochrome c553
MRKLACALLAAIALPAMTLAADQEPLMWAYPQGGDAAIPANGLRTHVDNNLVGASYTGFPKAPRAVARGNPLPCMQCHLGNGKGHPESSDITGLSEKYMLDQVHAFARGERNTFLHTRMTAAAQAVSEKDLKDAIDYYRSLPPMTQGWITTIIADEVPANYVGLGGMRFHLQGDAKTPLPQGQILEMVRDDDLVRARDMDWTGGFLQYVRPDDFALGEKLANTGDDGRTVPCASCHGEGFKGKGDAPRLAGQHGWYLIRQMRDIQTGRRNDPGAASMKAVLAKLGDRDIVALAGYLTSKPQY